MFATGIENSIPTIQQGRVRVDEMEKCKHYQYWREDFQLVEEMGICFLRYGPPLHKTFLGAEQYDWEFADLTFNDLRRRDLVPIVDLCHFGVPTGLAGEFSESRLSRIICRLCAGVCKAISLGAALYANQ